MDQRKQTASRHDQWNDTMFEMSIDVLADKVLSYIPANFTIIIFHNTTIRI